MEHGASMGETPAQVIKKCKYTIAMLSDPCAALSVYFSNLLLLSSDDKIYNYCCGVWLITRLFSMIKMVF